MLNATNQGSTSICDPGNVDVILPAVWQVESDAPSYVLSKAHISYGAEADVEEGDDAHPQIQNRDESLRPLHLVLQGKNLPIRGDKNTTRLLIGQWTKWEYDLWVALSFDIWTTLEVTVQRLKENVLTMFILKCHFLSGCDVLILAYGRYNEG